MYFTFKRHKSLSILKTTTLLIFTVIVVNVTAYSQDLKACYANAYNEQLQMLTGQKPNGVGLLVSC